MSENLVIFLKMFHARITKVDQLIENQEYCFLYKVHPISQGWRAGRPSSIPPQVLVRAGFRLAHTRILATVCITQSSKQLCLPIPLEFIIFYDKEI